jgi:flagella basal body P-ring formation protein FlgA
MSAGLKQLPALAVALSLLASPALPQTTAIYRDGISGVEMQELAQAAMQRAQVSGQISISSRRPYPPCATAPTVTPQKGKWSMLKVTCSGKSSWTRHIRTSIKPGRYIAPSSERDGPDGPTVAVLNKSLKKDSVITAADIEMRVVSKSTAGGSFSNPAHVIGQKLSKNLSEGRPIQARHLQKNYMIGRDMPVAIQFSGNGMTISTPGISLQNGELGEYVEVKNLSSGTVLKGMVAGPQKIIVRAKTH